MSAQSRESNNCNDGGKKSLSMSEKHRIAVSRDKALTLRHGKVQRIDQDPNNTQKLKDSNIAQKSSKTSLRNQSSWSHVEILSKSGSVTTVGSVSYGSEKRVVDTAAGFFLEEEVSRTGSQTDNMKNVADSQQGTIGNMIYFGPEQPQCEDCDAKFPCSFLLTNFDISVCDACKDMKKEEGAHELITKTEAKSEFLLKDLDLDGCGAFEGRGALRPLKFLVRKNPHNPRWGEMRLYLRCQVEARALEVWGSESALEQEITSREGKREKSKIKRFNKQIKELKMKVRGSLYAKDLSRHAHEFGEEEGYDEEADEYFKTCKTCSHVSRYQKM